MRCGGIASGWTPQNVLQLVRVKEGSFHQASTLLHFTTSQAVVRVFRGAKSTMNAVPATAESSEYVRVKRKRQTIFLYANMPIDTVHDLRARANLVTKVPTSEMRFFLDESGEVLLDENKTLKEQKVSHSLYGPKAQPTPRAPRAPKLPSRRANLFRMPHAPLRRLRTTWCCTWSTGFRVRAVYARARRPETTPRSLTPDLPFCIPTARASLTSLRSCSLARW